MLRHTILLLRCALMLLPIGLLGGVLLAPAQGNAVPAQAARQPEAEAAPASDKAKPRSEATPSQRESTKREAADKPALEAKPTENAAAKSPAVPTARAGAAERVAARSPEQDTRFAALGSDLVVQMHSPGSAALRWGDLVQKNGQLVFGAPQSTASIIWDTVLDLGEYMLSSIHLVAGESANELAAVRMQREVIGRHEVELWGSGRMDLAAANEHFSGRFNISSAQLRLAEEGSLHKGTAVQIRNGGSFVIDNSDLDYVTNNRFRSGEITFSGGEFRYLTRDNAAAIEKMGIVRVRTGANKFEISGGGGGLLGTTLSIAQLRFNPRASLDFVSSAGADFDGRTAVKFVRRPELLHGVIAQATVNGRDWATVDKDNRLSAYSAYESGSEAAWGPTVNAAPEKNQVLTADRQLASLKLAGEGTPTVAPDGRIIIEEDEDRNQIGRIVDLKNHKLTLTGAGLMATGDEWRHQIRGGTLTTTQENYTIHVSGAGGLALENTIITNGPGGKTGLVKTGDGELLFTSPKQGPGVVVRDNSFTGDVYVLQGTLTLFRKKSPTANIPGANIYVGGGDGDAALNIKSASEQINKNAIVTLRGGAKNKAIFRLEKLQAGRGPRQTLKKLVVDGAGVIDFRDSHHGAGEVTENSKSILYLGELEVHGSLVVLGWDKYNTHLLIDSETKPTDELLAKIKFEGDSAGATIVERFWFNKKNYWEIKAEFVFPPDPEPWPGPEAPEPATSGAILMASGLALATWYRRQRLKKQRAKR